jgi:Nif-specific regulatory protein
MASRQRARTEETLDPQQALSSGNLRPGRGPDPDRLMSIYGIGRQLLEQREPKDVIRTIHEALLEHLQPDHSAVLSISHTGVMKPLASHRLDLTGPEADWQLSHTACKKARESGLAVLMADQLDNLSIRDADSVDILKIRSIICVPLGQDPIRGLIYLDHRGGRRMFTREDLEFVTALSLYTAVLVQRTREFVKNNDALRSTNERLSLLETELLRYHIVGRASNLLSAFDQISRLAAAGASVILRGETGTGKELFARAYADNSDRRGKPYVPVPIPALAPTVIESELFGHVKGAFTEARQDKKGRLEVAHGGVLFLDEVGDIEPALQTKLLRFLDSGELYRVGDTRPRYVDAYIVSATNRPLEKLVEDGRFRADLLARLGQNVKLPALRERQDDILLLVEHFTAMYDRGPVKKTFAQETIDLLVNYRWEFNVRQLKQVIQSVLCLSDNDDITPDDLPEFIRADAPSAVSGRAAFGASTGSSQLSAASDGGEPRSLKEVMDETEHLHIVRALEFTKGNKRKAIEILKISPDTFYKRLEQFGLHKKSS